MSSKPPAPPLGFAAVLPAAAPGRGRRGSIGAVNTAGVASSSLANRRAGLSPVKTGRYSRDARSSSKVESVAPPQEYILRPAPAAYAVALKLTDELVAELMGRGAAHITV